MTNALVYIFACAALVLLVGFGLAAWLSWRHMNRRNSRSANIELDDPGGTRTASAKHLTIGDLVRDQNLAAAAQRGMAARSEMRAAAAVRDVALGARVTVVLKRNVREGFYFDVLATDGTVIATSPAHDSKASALAALEQLGGALVDET
ncbi:MAG TPA: hypothetical protein VLK36_13865 [Gaiellaceae bacterium]|nr:hypothetical protein [Gaiellaceae bacterium]